MLTSCASGAKPKLSMLRTDKISPVVVSIVKTMSCIHVRSTESNALLVTMRYSGRCGLVFGTVKGREAASGVSSGATTVAVGDLKKARFGVGRKLGPREGYRWVLGT